MREFTREPILLEGETADDLAPGSARHRAVESAIDELDAGRETPSAEWRRRYSLLLGLERLLSTEPVELADGAELTEHQVDVLSGTLAALTAELEDSVAAEASNGAGNGEGVRRGAPEANGADAANGDRAGRRRRGRRPSTPTRSPRTGRSRRRSWSTRRPRTPAPAAGSGSSTRPDQARRWQRWASWRARGRAAF